MNGKQRYTERAMRILTRAQEEARNRGAQAMDTGDILSGLLKERGSVALMVLEAVGISPEKIQAELERKTDRNETVAGVDTVTPSAKKVLQFTREEAASLGHSYIGTEHILLALVREEEGVAGQILQGLGAVYQKLREEAVKRVGGFTGQSPQGLDADPRIRRGDRRRTPTLDTFGRDLTELAKAGKLDPVIGRELEVERVIQILSRRTKNNPVLMESLEWGKQLC